LNHNPAKDIEIDVSAWRTEQRGAPGGSADDNSTPEEVLALERLAALSRLLDHAFRVPGTNIRFGVDAVLGIVPGIGDVLSNVISAYLVLEARKLGVTGWDMTRMIGNIAVDAGVSAIPFAGDIFDVFWKANDRNMKILHDHLARRGRIIDGHAVRVG